MRGVGIYGGMVPAMVDTAELADLLERKTAEFAAHQGGRPVDPVGDVAETLATCRGRGLVRPAPAPAASAELPRWSEAHDCGAFAEHVSTWPEQTEYSLAVWLVHECTACGHVWDVLSDESAEAVICASVYPVWAVKSCGLCCAGKCTGPEHPCPCHVVPGELA